MKTKTILSILFLFLIIKIQAQIPSINETKSLTFQNTISFQNDYKKILEESIKKLEIKKEKLNIELEKKPDSMISNKIQQIDKEIELVNSQIINIKKDRSYEGYKKHYDTIINRKNDSINRYYKVVENSEFNKNELDSINKLIDIKKQQLQLIIIERNEKLASLDKFQWMLPTWKKANRKKFFHDMYGNEKKTNFLSSFNLTSNKDASSTQTELVTDNMSALRITLGSVLNVATSNTEPTQTQGEIKKETEEEAFSRLISGGGNFYLEAILPLASTNQNNGNQITSYTYANVKGAMDIEKFNSNIDTSTGNAGLGFTTYLGISSDNKKFNFFGILNANYTVGSKAFYNNLGLSKEQAFFNAKFTAGVTILNTLKLTAIINNWASDEKLRSGKIIVGVQILPGL